MPSTAQDIESLEMMDDYVLENYAYTRGSSYADDVSLIENYQEPSNPEDATYCQSQDSYAGDASIIQNFVDEPAKPLKRNREETVQYAESSETRPSKLTKTSAGSFETSSAVPEIHHNAHIIVHCNKIVSLMNKFNLARGVRYELARLISKKQIKQNDVTENTLKQLQGSNEEAVPKISRVFALLKEGDAIIDDIAFAKEVAAHSPWKELDVEDAALSRGPYEGLGNNPAMPNWYGGKIQFRGHLQIGQKDGSGKLLKLTLDKLSLGSSCRFTRRFGSWSFIRVKIPEQLYYNDKAYNLLSYFSQPFVIWDSVFRACYAKGDNVFLYMTNEVYPSFHKVEGRLSVEGLIIWFNPMEENRKQLMTKWSSRMVLGFSNSIPGPRLEEGSILPEQDIVSEDNSDMTDGCGLSTRKIHHEILLQLGLPVFPTAFQFRVAGCKGMSLISEDPQFKDDRKIWVRPSQTKIRYPQGIPSDPAMLTIDLLRTPHMRSGTRLSNDMIINLAENGVPDSVFVNLFKSDLDQLVKGLTTWEGPDAMFDLWCNLEKVGGVLAGRRAREAVGEARVRGYSSRSPEEMEVEDDGDEDDISNGVVRIPKSVAWWNDQTSGSPSTLEETVMSLLDSGFRPQELPVLREKLKKVTTTKIDNRIDSLRFEIAQSCIAFAVPDPYGVLGPDEIQIKSSSSNLKLEDGTTTDIILGDVLIGRNPTKNPCDIRKVKAVEHLQLRNLVDVIVCSVQGLRRLIDFLAGGDYDGDTLVAIWQLSIVLPFQNADEKYSKTPLGLDVCFQTDKETVGDFIQRTKSWTSEMRTEAMQKYLLGGLSDPSLVGKYSAMHEYATYTLGYQNPRTVKLNAKFCTILDSSKNGQRIKPETLRDDTAKYSHPLGPQWKVKHNDKNKLKYNKTNATYPERKDLRLKRFIMDILVSAARKERERLMKEMDEVFAELTDRRPDPHLIQPWLDAQEWARRGPPEYVVAKKKELDLIAAHVQDVFRQHKEEQNKTSNNNQSFTDLRIETRQDFLRKYSRMFQSGPSLDLLPSFVDQNMLSRIRASYAYLYDSEQGYRKWSRFPWNVDYRQLCAIKAAALGPYKVVTQGFYERFKLVKRN